MEYTFCHRAVQRSHCLPYSLVRVGCFAINRQTRILDVRTNSGKYSTVANRSLS